MIDAFLKENLLVKFDVVLWYDVSNGTCAAKGGETFAWWPAWKEKALPTTPREGEQVLTLYLRFCSNFAKLKP